MSWIQENKFVAGWAGVTAVIAGGILYVGLSQGSAFDEKLEQYQDLKGRYAQLEKSKPYPSAANLSEREDKVEQYEEAIKEVRNLVSGYRPEKLEKMTPEQFKDIQVKMTNDLNKLFEDAKTELPSDCLFGCEKYATSSVRAGATAKLNYELGAIHWMLKKLAEVKPRALHNIRRVELPEESGRVAKIEPQPRKGKKRVSAKGGRNAQLAAGRAYQLMPVELSFTASESSVREFLLALVNSKEYYYAIRSMRIQSEGQSPPNQSDADFPAEASVSSGDDGFADLEGFGDDAKLEPSLVEDDSAKTKKDQNEAEAEKSSSQPSIPAGELILKQVLGDEELHVHLCLDIVLIEKKTEAAPKKGSSR